MPDTKDNLNKKNKNKSGASLCGFHILPVPVEFSPGIWSSSHSTRT